MFGFAGIAHAYRVVQHHARRVTKGRSPHWATCRKNFLKTHSSCAACGSKTNLDVHHVEPYHLKPALELDQANLLTLCMGHLECHLRIGHGGNYKAYNPLVREDAASVLSAPAGRKATEKKAHDLRLYKDPLA